MEKSFRPSKQFLIRASIGLGVLALIFIVQSTWFRGLFKKKGVESTIASETVEEIVGKDSNQNGIADWEERLWGLDPAVRYTDGVSNKELIEQRKRSLGGGTDTSLNETDQLARELFALTTALGQSDEVDMATFQKIGQKLGESAEVSDIGNHYSFQSIKLATTTRAALETYYSTLSRIVGKYDEDTDNIDILINSLESGNFSRLGELGESEILYKKLAAELAAVRVPLGVAEYHLKIINGLYGMAESFKYLGEIEDDGVQGIAGISIYKTYAVQFQVALNNMSSYLTQYGIL